MAELLWQWFRQSAGFDSGVFLGLRHSSSTLSLPLSFRLVSSRSALFESDLSFSRRGGLGVRHRLHLLWKRLFTRAGGRAAT